MPTYEYACTVCGHTFEQFQSFSEDSLKHCPKCNGRLRKVFNAVGVVFKGSGFYRNDSRATATGSTTRETTGEGKSGDTAKAPTKDSSSSPSSDSSSSGSSSSPSKDSSAGSSTAAKPASTPPKSSD